MNKIKMDHNEYQKYLENNANRIYTDEKYGFKNYLEDANNVDILPYNLSNFNLSKELEKIININFDRETKDKNGHYMLKGFTNSEGEWYRLTDQMELKRTMGYYYSGYCYNSNYNMVMTYAEGDLYLKLFDNKKDYTQELEETIKWYDEN